MGTCTSSDEVLQTFSLPTDVLQVSQVYDPEKESSDDRMSCLGDVSKVEALRGHEGEWNCLNVNIFYCWKVSKKEIE